MLNISKIDNFIKLAKQNDQEIDFGGVGVAAEGGGGEGIGRGGGKEGEEETKQNRYCHCI